MRIVFCVDLGMLETFLGSPMYHVTWQVWSEKKRCVGYSDTILIKKRVSLIATILRKINDNVLVLGCFLIGRLF